MYVSTSPRRIRTGVTSEVFLRALTYGRYSWEVFSREVSLVIPGARREPPDHQCTQVSVYVKTSVGISFPSCVRLLVRLRFPKGVLSSHQFTVKEFPVVPFFNDLFSSSLLPVRLISPPTPPPICLMSLHCHTTEF